MQISAAKITEQIGTALRNRLDASDPDDLPDEMKLILLRLDKVAASRAKDCATPRNQ
jgi:predicted lipid carrier protein YhbT